VIPTDAGPSSPCTVLCIQVGGGRKELVRSYTPALVITRRPPTPSRGVRGFSAALFSQKPSLKEFGLPWVLRRNVAAVSCSHVSKFGHLRCAGANYAAVFPCSGAIYLLLLINKGGAVPPLCWQVVAHLDSIAPRIFRFQ
jgi:hypothetical protein